MQLTTIDPHLRVAPTLRVRAPGQVLLRDYLEPRGWTAATFARRSGISETVTNDIIQRGYRISANSAMRLAAVLGTSALYWMVLQAQYNLQTEMERREPSAPGVL